MSGNAHKGKVSQVMAPPINVVAKLTVTAYSDRPPNLECTADVATALRLLGVGITILGNSLSQKAQEVREVKDKKREFLGPRGMNESITS